MGAFRRPGRRDRGLGWGALIRLAAPGRTAFALAVAAIVVSVSPSGLLDAAAWPAQLSFALSALFWLLLVPFWLRGRWAVGAASGILVGVVLLVPTALALVLLRESGPWVLLAMMAAVWVADIGLSSSVGASGVSSSPRRSARARAGEGAYGAILAVWVYGALVLTAGFKLSPGVVGWLAFGAVLALLTVVSIMGDPSNRSPNGRPG